MSLLNFFIDRDVIPIEITFDRDQSRSDLVDIFESLKSKIGPARNYGLTKEEQDEIGRLKAAIGAKEAAGKAEKERQRACEELQKKEKEIAEWVS